MIKPIWLILAVIVIGFELFTNFTGRPTLTDVTLEYTPSWLIMPFLTWLWGHFAINYAEQSKRFGPIVRHLPHWIIKLFGG